MLQNTLAPVPLPETCRGIIAFTPGREELSRFMGYGLPIVLFNLRELDEDVPSAARRLPCIQFNTEEFGVKAADHFLSLTPRTFAYVGDRIRSLWSDARGEAFVRRIRETGHEAHLYKSADETPSPGEDARRLQAWLKSLPKPISVYVANDARGRDVLNACLCADIVVPYEASILGTDNDEWICESTWPRLSSIPFRSEEGGFEVARMMDEILRHEDGQQTPLPSRRLIMPPGDVVVRESTGAARPISDPIASRALMVIHASKGLGIRTSDVARELDLSANWVERRFRKELGVSIKDEIARVRLETILQLIRETNIPFREISKRCGFTTPTTLCHFIKKATGHAMTDLRAEQTRPHGR